MVLWRWRWDRVVLLVVVWWHFQTHPVCSVSPKTDMNLQEMYHLRSHSQTLFSQAIIPKLHTARFFLNPKTKLTSCIWWPKVYQVKAPSTGGRYTSLRYRNHTPSRLTYMSCMGLTLQELLYIMFVSLRCSFYKQEKSLTLSATYFTDWTLVPYKLSLYCPASMNLCSWMSFSICSLDITKW